jgi:hypothetical protein
MEKEFYRPVNIDFKIGSNDTNAPERLGFFKTAEEAQKHMALNFASSMNKPLTAARYMDSIEKEMKRQEYRDTLEDILPNFEKALIQAETQLIEAKKKQKDAEEAYNVTMNHAKELAYEVKRGLQDMDLDEKHTFRIASNGRYFFYTYIDQQLKLAKIMDIPEHEKSDLWNVMAGNQAYFEHLQEEFKSKNNPETFADAIKDETGAQGFKVFATGPDGVEKEIDLAKLEKIAKKGGKK